MTMKKVLLAATALTAAAAMALPALAKSDKERIRELEQRLERMEQMLSGQARPAAAGGTTAALEQKVQDLEISQGARINALEQRANDVQWIYDNGRPTIRSGDGRFELAIRGRFHFDAGVYSQDPSNNVPFSVGGENVRDLGAGSFFRRTQFGVEGKVFRDFDYEFRYNFGGSENETAGSINIMRVAYNVTPFFRINVGAIQPTFTLDDSTSSNDITFLERASVINAFLGEFGGSDGRKGIEMTYLQTGTSPGNEWMVNVAYTTSVVGPEATRSTADDRDHLLVRAAWRPYANDLWDVHVGANYATILGMGQVDQTALGPTAARNVRFRDRPELRVAGERLVDTGNIAAEGGNVWGIEAGLRYQQFYLAGEYFKWSVDRDRACAGCNTVAPDPEFSGWYVQATWMLTSGINEVTGGATEFKRYGTQGASNSRMQFGAPRPASPFSLGGTWGGWELAARYSSLDLDFNVNPLGLPMAPASGTAGVENVNYMGAPIANAGEIRGGKQDIITLGLNWYLNRNVRVMFQYQNIDVSRLSSTPLCTLGAGASSNVCVSTTTNPGLPDFRYGDIGQKIDTFAIRTQFAF